MAIGDNNVSVSIDQVNTVSAATDKQSVQCQLHGSADLYPLRIVIRTYDFQPDDRRHSHRPARHRL